MSKEDPGRRGMAVAVTGLGAVSGWGWGVEALWRGLERVEAAIRPTLRFDLTGQRTRLASEVPEAPAALVARVPDWLRLSWADRFAVAAALEACDQAAVDPSHFPSGVFFGGSTAGMAEGEEYFASLIGEREDPARLRSLVSHQMNGPGDEVARLFGISGPVYTVSSACAAGGLALGAALDALRAGEVQLALAGGADALCKLTYAGFNSLRAVDEAPSRPFRSERAGLSLGEGAGVLVLETLEGAKARGATPLALLLGVGASRDAYHMTAPHPAGAGAARAIRAALVDAELAPEAIDFVNAHGTGTPLNDAAEALAIANVFGERSGRLPVTSTKASVGHLLGSSGALEAVATILSLRHGAIHATPGAGALDPALAVDVVVGAARPVARGGMAVSTSFAFGGANAAVVIGGVEDAAP